MNTSENWHCTRNAENSMDGENTWSVLTNGNVFVRQQKKHRNSPHVNAIGWCYQQTGHVTWIVDVCIYSTGHTTKGRASEKKWQPWPVIAEYSLGSSPSWIVNYNGLCSVMTRFFQISDIKWNLDINWRLYPLAWPIVYSITVFGVQQPFRLMRNVSLSLTDKMPAVQWKEFWHVDSTFAKPCNPCFWSESVHYSVAERKQYAFTAPSFTHVYTWALHGVPELQSQVGYSCVSWANCIE